MEDDLFDNGIDGTPWGEGDQYDFLQQVYEDGGTVIHHDPDVDLLVVYYSGQWNDSGVDPDSISISLESNSFDKKGYWVGIQEDKVSFNTPDKEYFQIEAKVHLTDFLDISSPMPIEVYRTHLPNLIDAISAKQITVKFDREKFISKIKRYENLLVFG